jgi:HPt (histidine-containing phosphotransfer) domain-containing protein
VFQVRRFQQGFDLIVSEYDWTEALRLMAGAVELLCSTAEMVAEDAPLELTVLENAVQAGNLAAAARSAHALTGMLSTFENDKVVAGLQRIEAFATDGDLDQASNLSGRLRADIVHLIAKINTLAASGIAERNH